MFNNLFKALELKEARVAGYNAGYSKAKLEFESQLHSLMNSDIKVAIAMLEKEYPVKITKIESRDSMIDVNTGEAYGTDALYHVPTLCINLEVRPNPEYVRVHSMKLNKEQK